MLKGVSMNTINVLLASKKFIPCTKTTMVIGDTFGRDLTLSKGKFHNTCTRTITENLGPCTKLTMWIGKHKYEGNSAPELEPIENVYHIIDNIVETLRGKVRNSFDEVHAFITGGIGYNPKNPVSKQSMDLIEEMYEALYKQGVPTSVVAAQKGNGTKTALGTLAFKDNIYVFGKPIDEIVLSSQNGDMESILNNHFDYVELTKEVPVKIVK